MFSEKLKELRKSKNITQEELADKIFVSRSAIARWESDKGIPSDVNLQSLCKFFDVGNSYFLDTEDYKNELKRVNEESKKKNISLLFILLTLVFFCVSFIPIFYYRFDGPEILSSLYRPSLSIMNLIGFFSYFVCFIYSISIVYSIVYSTNILNIKDKTQSKLFYTINICSTVMFLLSIIISIINGNKNNYGLFWKGENLC